jgi:hypothetical protein
MITRRGKPACPSQQLDNCHSLDGTRREHRPFFEPMTGSLGTTPFIHHQLDSASDSSALARCTLASAPNPDYTRNSPPPLSHCAASFCTVNSKAPGGHGGSNSRLPPPTPALSPLHQVDEFKDFPGPHCHCGMRHARRAARRLQVHFSLSASSSSDHPINQPVCMRRSTR